MSPTIPILSALLLSLISTEGSTECGQRTDSVSLLRQTLQYWWKIYNTYYDEVTLGYCWADYLFKISSESLANQSAPLFAATGDRFDTTAGTTESQRNPFPRNVMADAATPFRETREGERSREKRSHATARSTISKFANGPDGHRVASKSKIIQRRKKGMMNKTRQRAPWIVPRLLRDEREAPRDAYELSSRGTSSHAVNPTPNPKDDDKVDSGSTDLGEDSRRKVLRSLTSHRDSFVENALASLFISFSLKVALGRRRGSLDGHRYSSSGEGNSRVDEMSSDPWMPQEDRVLERAAAGRRAPLNNDGSSSAPSRSQFRRINADAERSMNVVKLMDSERNSSCDPTINPKTPRRKPEELSCDPLLSPRGGSAIAELSPLESRGSGGEAVERNALPRFETAGGSDAKRRRYQQSKEEERSRAGRDVSAVPATIHPFFLWGLEALHQQMLHESRGSSAVPEILQRSRQDDPIRIARSAPSLSSVGQFVENDENSASRSPRNSELTALEDPKNRDHLSHTQQSCFLSSIRSFVIAIFRTLEMFVQVGRQIINIGERNAAIACTKEYLSAKIIKWLDLCETEVFLSYSFPNL